MATQLLYPNAAGDLTQFSTVSSGTHFEAVDETSADDDTSYIRSGLDEADETWSIVIKENSTTTAVAKSATSTYANYTNEFTVKPSDSSAFTVTDINNLQIGVKYTGDDNPINQTDLFNIQDWPNNSGDTINSVTVTARWKSSSTAAFSFMQCTQVFVSVDYTEAVAAVTTGPFKIQAGAKVKITSGKLTIE
jgi:hypothetical protein